MKKFYLPILFAFVALGANGQEKTDNEKFDISVAAGYGGLLNSNLSPYGLTESHVRYILNSRIPVENFWEKMQKSHAILENINLIFRDMDLRKQVWSELRALGLCSVTASTPENIEITSPLATKAKALETLCALLGIEAEHVLAMGDSDNDLPMLEFAGIGVAMANGEAHIKAAADMIAEDCNHFGAAKILEQLLKERT